MNSNKGLANFAGGMVVGAGLLFAAKKFLKTEQGQAWKAKIQEKMKKMHPDFYQFVAPLKYKMAIKKAAEDFCEMNELAADKAGDLIKQTYKMWSDFAKGLEE